MGKLIRQFAKFGVVGFLSFIVDYGLLMALTQIFLVDARLAAAISFCVSLIFNYWLSMRFVFVRRDDISKRRECITFVILSLIGLLLNELIIWLGLELVGESAFTISITKIIATVIVSFWNFFSRKRLLDSNN